MTAGAAFAQRVREVHVPVVTRGAAFGYSPEGIVNISAGSEDHRYGYRCAPNLGFPNGARETRDKKRGQRPGKDLQRPAGNSHSLAGGGIGGVALGISGYQWLAEVQAHTNRCRVLHWATPRRR